MRKQIQKFIWKFLERELTTVLAISIIGLGAVMFTRADTVGYTPVTFRVVPANGAITVTDPDGGENWSIGSSQNITWETDGEVADVKIELQRDTGGSWETIIASTTNDGSHPWAVTGPATTTAKIKVTEVGDDTVTDQSDAVFSITTTTTGGGGYNPGGGVTLSPMIDLVAPREFSNNSEITLSIRGSYIESGAKVYLGLKELSVSMNLGYELKAIVPVGFASGQHQLKVVNPTGAAGIYGTLIKVTDQKYEAIALDQSPSPVDLLPGEKTELWVKIKNTSNYTWVRDGSNQVQLGVPGDKKSLFYDPATWILNYRAARMEESAVAPSQIATFRFYAKAPTVVGSYTDSFSLVLENIKWLNMPAVSWQLHVRSTAVPPTTGGIESYADRLVKQSPQRIELAPGQTATVWVDFENTGTVTWTPDGKHPVRIGTAQRRDRVSRFRGSGWVLKDRPSNVEGVTPPGSVGRFTINIKAPSRIGAYREYFGLVAEHKTWIEGELVYWDIVVKRPAKAPVRGVTQLPSTGGGLGQPPFSSAPVVFSDGLERTLGQLFGAISNLWQKLGGFLRGK